MNMVPSLKHFEYLTGALYDPVIKTKTRTLYAVLEERDLSLNKTRKTIRSFKRETFDKLKTRT